MLKQTSYLEKRIVFECKPCKVLEVADSKDSTTKSECPLCRATLLGHWIEIIIVRGLPRYENLDNGRLNPTELG